jgi:DNA-binding LytR/AlgR family response regulator
MTRALIADDEPNLAQYLADQIGLLWPELEIVHVARNGIEAAREIARLQPELAFLDVQMPGLSGLEVAQGIEGATRVIFVTAYDEYAVQAFEHAALDYVLKPVKNERLARTLERIKLALAVALPAHEFSDSRLSEALKRLLPHAPTPAPQRLRYVRASQGELTHQIAVDDVMYFQADEKYTVVTTTAGEYLIRTPIVDLADQLDPDQFWQVHRSILINLAYISGTKRDETSRLFVRIKGREVMLPVSRAYVHLFKAM